MSDFGVVGMVVKNGSHYSILVCFSQVWYQLFCPQRRFLQFYLWLKCLEKRMVYIYLPRSNVCILFVNQ
jgi:hypothetical protein